MKPMTVLIEPSWKDLPSGVFPRPESALDRRPRRRVCRLRRQVAGTRSSRRPAASPVAAPVAGRTARSGAGARGADRGGAIRRRTARAPSMVRGRGVPSPSGQVRAGGAARGRLLRLRIPGRDIELGRMVAIKIPRAGSLASKEDAARFLREARSAAQLKHPGIVALHETGQAERRDVLPRRGVRPGDDAGERPG